ncbi:MAG: hypothetical protein SVO26_03525 [Chloroflexota bacterium]|nr:hypothetical protein [Chloroflexota bacterium]
MLQLRKTSITLTEEDITELEEIISSEDREGAFEFLKTSLYKKIDRSQVPYNPVHGTIGHRRHPFGAGR